MSHPASDIVVTGAGLMCLGLLQAGVRVKQSVDLDKNSVRTMQMNPHYFNHRIVWDDVTQMMVLEQDQTDMQVFTYPCTKYSTIGDIHGVRTGDDLFLHSFRHFAIRQPQMYVIENVPGMKKFKVVMEAMTKLPGYYVHVFCPLDASIWLPQSRPRLIIIGTKKPFPFSHPDAPVRKVRIKDILEKDPDIRVNKTVYSRINGEYRDQPIIVDPDNPDSIAPTCVAHYAKDMGTRLVKDLRYPAGLRPFTIREYARLQGLPDDFILPQKNYAYKQIGNGVAVPVARWIGEQAMRYFN